MTPARIFGFISLLAGALLVGLLIDWEKDDRQTSDLEIPDNIDYYLADVRLKSFDEQGDLRYRLDSSYLEHFVREDISKLKQPKIDYFAAQKSAWSIHAQSGALQHQNELFELRDQVVVTRVDRADGLRLSSNLMVLDPAGNTLSIPQALRLTSASFDMTAASAQLDIDKDQHVFKRVKAVYDNRSGHEAG